MKDIEKLVKQSRDSTRTAQKTKETLDKKMNDILQKLKADKRKMSSDVDHSKLSALFTEMGTKLDRVVDMNNNLTGSKNDDAKDLIAAMSSYNRSLIGEGGLKGMLSVVVPRQTQNPSNPISINVGQQQQQPGQQQQQPEGPCESLGIRSNQNYKSPAIQTDKPLDELSSMEVYQWCASNGFTPYRDKMKDLDITGRMLINMTEENMNALDMTSVHIATLQDIQAEFKAHIGQGRRRY